MVYGDGVEPLKLRFIGSLVEQLGKQLYPSATATVAELVSNAWDADAKNVWIDIPLGEEWSAGSKIVVVDDGHGMTREDARTAYLVVGRKRRLATGPTSPGGRKVHGRKGIGKLAAFGTATLLDCSTLRDGMATDFRLNYDEIRRKQPSEDYGVEVPDEKGPLLNPETTVALEHGTRVTLSGLHLKRALPQGQFMGAMARRFAIDSHEMRISINGETLQHFDMPVEIRFPRDGVPNKGITEDREGWACEALAGGHDVKWWIGFTEKPLEENLQQGVSVLANGKMAQRPFQFVRAQGTEGQLGQEYLVGEVQADWIDSGVDIEDDLIQSNRDQLQLEDVRLAEFLEWGRSRVQWALRERNEIRRELRMKEISEVFDIGKLLVGYTSRERSSLLRVAASISRIPETSGKDVENLMRDVVNARSDVVVRQMMETIQSEPEFVQERMWGLVQEFGLIDARRTMTLIEARLETISRLATAIEGGAREVPELHEIVRDDAWLIDPRLHLYDDEVEIEKVIPDYEPEFDEEGLQIDFLFIFQPKEPAPIDEVVVVEIKRGSHPDGKIHKANDAEVQKFQNYVLAAKDYYDRNSRPPRVRGLMIAQDYTDRAERLRRSMEQRGVPTFEFKTWDTLIHETERMHLGWLEVSRRRVARAE